MSRIHTAMALVVVSACSLEVDDPGEPRLSSPASPPAPPATLPAFVGESVDGATGTAPEVPPPTRSPERQTVTRLVPTPGDSRPARSDVDPAPVACDIDASTCADREPLCLSNDDCPDGLCVNGSCHDFCDVDMDCEAGAACVLGLCRTSPSGRFECLGADDCAESDDCVSTSCLRRCGSDADCAGCDDGPTCSFGYCGL